MLEVFLLAQYQWWGTYMTKALLQLAGFQMDMEQRVFHMEFPCEL